jgi:hypothetical protein
VHGHNAQLVFVRAWVAHVEYDVRVAFPICLECASGKIDRRPWRRAALAKRQAGYLVWLPKHLSIVQLLLNACTVARFAIE